MKLFNTIKSWFVKVEKVDAEIKTKIENFVQEIEQYKESMKEVEIPTIEPITEEVLLPKVNKPKKKRYYPPKNKKIK